MGIKKVKISELPKNQSPSSVEVPGLDNTNENVSTELVALINTLSDAKVLNVLKHVGAYDASSNQFPSTGGSGTGGAILRGNLWNISVPGTLGGVSVGTRIIIVALVDSPGQTASNWFISANEETTQSILQKIGDGSQIGSQYLPSYVDDVIEVADYASLPSTGEQGKIYITLDNNHRYRWSGTVWVDISNPLSYTSQAEAETTNPTENTKVTTILRVFQGFVYWVANVAFAALNTTSKNLIGAINELVSGKQNSLGYTAENVANKSTDVETDGASNDKYPSVKAVKDYADSLVVGLWDDRGNYDASVNTFPASGGSGDAGAILKGDIWTISVAGTLGGEAVMAGQTVRALQDAPGQTSGNWAISASSGGGSSSISRGNTYSTAFDFTIENADYILEERGVQSGALTFTLANASTKQGVKYYKELETDGNTIAFPDGWKPIYNEYALDVGIYSIEVFYDGTNYQYWMWKKDSADSPPVASSITIVGTLQDGEQITGSYVYYDADSDAEDTSGTGSQYDLRIYTTSGEADSDTDGTGGSSVDSGSTGGESIPNLSYTIVSGDIGKYLKLFITPKNANATGSIYYSSTSGQIQSGVNILLSDDFNDNSLDGAKWSTSSPASMAITEQNQRLEVERVSTGNWASSVEYGVESVNSYSPASNIITLNFVLDWSVDSATDDCIIGLYDSTGDHADMAYFSNVTQNANVRANSRLTGSTGTENTTDVPKGTRCKIVYDISTGETEWYYWNGASWTLITTRTLNLGTSVKFTMFFFGSPADLTGRILHYLDNVYLTDADYITETP